MFVLLFFKRADVFPQWRNTLAAMTALAIIGFAFFPLMPPRLLDQPCPSPDSVEFGGACVESDLRSGKEKTFTGDNGFGFVDTLSVYGGPWRFDSEEVASISNQYAAMPSLHIGWSTWCALAVWPLLRRRWTKVAGAALSGDHAVLHRRHRQPLLARRRRRSGRVRASGRSSGGGCTGGTRIDWIAARCSMRC